MVAAFADVSYTQCILLDVDIILRPSLHRHNLRRWTLKTASSGGAGFFLELKSGMTPYQLSILSRDKESVYLYNHHARALLLIFLVQFTL